jgi:hypothetical protein
MAVYFVVNF